MGPSIGLAVAYLKETGKEDWSDGITRIIDTHHKRFPYRGPDAGTVETFRRADWIDVTLGALNFAVPRSTYEAVVANYPTAGFHRFLFVSTLKNLVRHTGNPLPMFKA